MGGGMKKMEWWGWIGIAVVFYGAKKAAGDHIAVASPEDIASIGVALSIYPYAFLYGLAGFLIWKSAQSR